jgi:hypothetical protein
MTFLSGGRGVGRGVHALRGGRRLHPWHPRGAAEAAGVGPMSTHVAPSFLIDNGIL